MEEKEGDACTILLTPRRNTEDVAKGDVIAAGKQRNQTVPYHLLLRAWFGKVVAAVWRKISSAYLNS